MVITLARDTGWSEDYILSTLSYAKVLLYWHAIAYASGTWTVAPSAPIASQIDTLLDG